MYNIRMYTPSSQAEACTACTGAILPPLPALGRTATLVWMESAYINKYIKTTSRMDKGRMDALVQAATLVRDGNAMARSHIPVKFSEKVQNLLSKVKDKELLTSSVQEYGACIDFTLSSHHEMPSPIMNKMQGVDETFRLRQR